MLDMTVEEAVGFFQHIPKITSDRLIDLGPEGGEEGGKAVEGGSRRLIGRGARHARRAGCQCYFGIVGFS